MTIDLNACTGCNACVVACQAEKIPIFPSSVKIRSAKAAARCSGFRIDRYYKGDIEAPEFVHQPVPCMHCE